MVQTRGGKRTRQETPVKEEDDKMDVDEKKKDEKPGTATKKMDLDDEDKELAGSDDDAEDYHIEEDTTQDVKITVSNLRSLLLLPDDVYSKKEKDATKKEFMSLVEEHAMTPYYKFVAAEAGWRVNATLVKKLESQNEADLDELDKKLAEMEKTAGETEVRDVMLEKADYYARIGDKDAAVRAYAATYEKTIGSGLRIDLVLSQIRLGLMCADMDLIKTNVAKAEALVEKGGDWERRNLLKVYRGVFAIVVRDFKLAAELLLDSVATFTCYPLMTYESFVFYAVLTALMSVDRPTLKKSVITSPEVLAVIDAVPALRPLVFALYQCDYAAFFRALSDISPSLKRDRYLAPHFSYYIREVRIVAYRQFLQAYKSVTLASMASSFGISVPFLDSELSRFISVGRLNAKIDKVEAVVETNRPDVRSALYQSLLKQGDALLGRIQKLTKIASY